MRLNRLSKLYETRLVLVNNEQLRVNSFSKEALDKRKTIEKKSIQLQR